MDNYPDTYMSVYLYIFYMTCPDPDMNPFFNMPEHEKEELIIDEINLTESPKFDSIRQSFKGAYNDMKDEQKSQVRGGQGLAYDQL